MRKTRHLKKIISILLALVMILGLSTAAFADTTGGSITVNNPQKDVTYTAYKIFDASYVKDGTSGDVTAISYTVSSTSKWWNTILNYMGTISEDNPTAAVPDADGIYTGKGITLTPAAGAPGTYVVEVKTNADAGETDPVLFSAAKFADYLLKKIPAGITGNALTTVGTGDNAVVKASDLDYGYYLVVGRYTKNDETKTEALANLTSTTPDVTIHDKNEAPEIEKKIVETGENGTSNKVENNNAAVGDTVNYEVTSNVPDMTGYTKYYFVLKDTLSKGLTFNNDIHIKVGDKDLVKNTDYTVTASPVELKDEDGKPVKDDEGNPVYTGETAVEIVFKNFIQYKELKNDAGTVVAKTGSPIVVTYSATVNENAVIGVEGNPNEVTLTYSNDPAVDDDGEPDNPDKPTPDSPTGETPEEETRTYVTGIELTKVDPAKNRLTGAEFKITGTKLNTVLVRKDVYTVDESGTYWKLKDGTYTITAPTIADDETDNSGDYDNITTKYAKTIETTPIVKAENVTYAATVGADGILRFEGLSAGEYTITEIKAPTGYNLLKDPIKVKIEWQAPAALSQNCTWSVVGGNGEIGVSDGIVRIEVENKTGSILPDTGGMGTTLFYLIGGILVVGAVVLLITRKRMNVGK